MVNALIASGLIVASLAVFGLIPEWFVAVGCAAIVVGAWLDNREQSEGEA